MASTVLPNGIIIPEKYSRDWYNDLYHNWEELDNLLAGGTPKDGTLTIQQNGSTVGTFSANQATDETVNITVPDVNDGTLTIQKNGTNVATFTSNSNTDVTADITVPTKTSDLTNDSCIPLSGTSDITGTGFFKSTSDSQLQIGSGTSTTTGGCFVAYGSEYSNTDGDLAGSFMLQATASSSSYKRLIGYPDGNLIWVNNLVISTNLIRRTDHSWFNAFLGGDEMMAGGRVLVYGYSHSSYGGWVRLLPTLSSSSFKEMNIRPDGTWTWDGTAVQITSDQRYKQQITEIDDKLLDAWEDVELCQFKYNDAVDEKGKDKARLHTGYVVQQIDKACKKHGVDVSAYGLYCHEEYPQETEEIEVEQKDGTKTKERKVIREASEHYSLRYTEALIVECKYLRRCIARLTARIEELEKGNNTK